MTAAPDFFKAEPRHWRARLAASVELVRELSRYSDPQEMQAVFIRRMSQLFPVSRQIAISRRGLHYPQYRVTRFNLWRDPVNPWKEPHRLPIHEGGLLAELVYADLPQVLDDVSLEDGDPAFEYLGGQRSIISLPHYDQGTVQNAVILGREEPNAFPRDRVADLVMLSNLFGRATQTLVLSQAVREAYEAVDYELRTVADIQKSLLPSNLPHVPGLDTAVYYQTAKRAGGDYYDFFPLPGGKLGVLIADASGHGAPAAVLMAIAHSIAHTRPDPPTRPGELLGHLNNHLTRHYTRQTGNFMTAFSAVFDPVEGTLTYASAGHNPPRFLRCSDGSRQVLNRAQRLPLGIKAEEVYVEQVIPIQSGDQVLLFTDGVIEAINSEGEVFGSERLDNAVAACPPTAQQLVQAVIREFDRFTAGVPVADDRTLVAVKRL
jgi:sigma-B regulation protein RsbU (phosphoserine phosphatase)